MDDDTAAEDWFTADFLEFADSLAGQPIPDLTGDDPDGERATFATPADRSDPPSAQPAVTPAA